jgi:hypothetical protein
MNCDFVKNSSCCKYRIAPNLTRELPFKAGTAQISQHVHIETGTSQISIAIQVKTDIMGALTENTCNMEPENTEQLH